MKWTIIFCAVILLFAAARFAAGSYDCWAQWGDSNMQYKFTMRAGCKIKTNDGWIPASNYRVK